MHITRDIELSEHRCFDCGRFWAIESAVSAWSICPQCAGDKVRAAELRASSLERSNRAYKANLTRRK